MTIVYLLFLFVLKGGYWYRCYDAWSHQEATWSILCN